MVWSPARRLRATFGFVLLSLAAQVWTSSVPFQRFWDVKMWVAWDLPALQALHLWAPFLRLWIQPDPGVHWGSLVMVALGAGLLEWRRGSRAAATAFLVLAPLATMACTLVLWPFWAAGAHNLHDYLFIPDVGSSSAAFLCWAVALRSLRPAVAVPLVALTAPILLVPFTFHAHGEFAFDHFFGFEVGLIASPWVAPRRARTRPAAGPRTEPQGSIPT